MPLEKWIFFILSNSWWYKKRMSAWDTVCFLEVRWIGRLQTHCHETCQTALRFKHGNGVTLQVITWSVSDAILLTKYCTYLKNRISVSQNSEWAAEVEDGKMSVRKRPQRTTLSPCCPAIRRIGLSPALAEGTVQNMNLRSQSTSASILTSVPAAVVAPSRPTPLTGLNYVPVTQRTHMAPSEENRDMRASSKAYVHLSPTPTQKHKVQNRLHAHIITTVCSQVGLGFCNHWVLRHISKLCGVFLHCGSDTLKLCLGWNQAFLPGLGWLFACVWDASSHPQTNGHWGRKE